MGLQLFALVCGDGRAFCLQINQELRDLGVTLDSILGQLRPRVWAKSQPGVYRIDFLRNGDITDMTRVGEFPLLPTEGDGAPPTAAPGVRAADDYAAIARGLRSLEKRL